MIIPGYFFLYLHKKKQHRLWVPQNSTTEIRFTENRKYTFVIKIIHNLFKVNAIRTVMLILADSFLLVPGLLGFTVWAQSSLETAHSNLIIFRPEHCK